MIYYGAVLKLLDMKKHVKSFWTSEIFPVFLIESKEWVDFGQILEKKKQSGDFNNYMFLLKYALSKWHKDIVRRRDDEAQLLDIQIY